MSRPKVIILLGTTASGKTKLGVKLAADFNGEIISADSRQVYKGMDIGTGKDLNEYKIKSKCQNPNAKSSSRLAFARAKRAKFKIKYHLIDIISPKKQFTLSDWLKETNEAISNILKRKKIPIIVGGTALYLNALINDYQLPPAKLDLKLRKKLEKFSLENLLEKLKKLDPQTFKTIDKKNRRRVQRALEIILQTKQPLSEQISPCQRGRLRGGGSYNFLILGITYPRQILNQRIDQRVEQRLNQGMVKEVKKLHQQGVSWQRLDDFGLEYRFISRYLRGQFNYAEMKEKLKIAIHQFAKKQMTWFSAKGGSASGGKKMGNIHWIKNYSQAKKIINKFLIYDL